MKKREAKKTTSENLESRFDEGEDVSDFFDTSKAKVVGNSKRVAIDFPQWIVDRLDVEAARIGLPRQALIKTVVARYVDELTRKAWREDEMSGAPQKRRA
jgi:hypothetical protein